CVQTSGTFTHLPPKSTVLQLPAFRSHQRSASHWNPAMPPHISPSFFLARSARSTAQLAETARTSRIVQAVASMALDRAGRGLGFMAFSFVRMDAELTPPSAL